MSDDNTQVISRDISEILFTRFYRIVDDTISLYKSYKKSIENKFDENDKNYKILQEIKNSKNFLESELGTNADQSKTVLSTLVGLTARSDFPRSKKFSHLNTIVIDLKHKISKADDGSISSVQPKNKSMREYISSIFHFHKNILEEFIYKIELIIFEDFIDILLKTKLFKYSFLNKTEEKDDYGSTLRFWKEVNSKGGITNMMYTIYGYVIKEIEDEPIKPGERDSILNELESIYNKEEMYFDDGHTLVNSIFPDTESETKVEDLHEELDGSEFTKVKGDDNYKLILNNEGYKISDYETLKNFIINSSIIFIGIGLNKLRFKIKKEDEIFKIKDLKTFIKEKINRSSEPNPEGVYTIKVENLINIDKNKYKDTIDKMKKTLKDYDSKFEFTQKETDLYYLVRKSKSKEAYSILVSLLFNQVVDVYIINALIEYFQINLSRTRDGKNIFKDFKYSETKREKITEIISSIIDYIINNTNVDIGSKILFSNENTSTNQYKNLVYLYILYNSATNKEKVKFSEELTEVFDIEGITSYINESEIEEGDITVDKLGNIKSNFALRIIDYFEK